MAAYMKSFRLYQLNPILTFCRSEQLNSSIRRISLHQCRSYSTKHTSNIHALRQSSLLYYGIGGVAAGALYTLYTENFKNNQPVLNTSEFKPIILKSLPKYQPARQISVPTDNTGLNLVLYQYPTCPFCCKVRAFLDYYGLSYDVIEVNPVLRQQISWSDYKKVPILLVKLEDGSYLQLNDSTMITSVLKTYLMDRKQSLLDIASCYPVMSYKDDEGNIKSEVQNRYFLMTNEEKVSKSKESILDEVKWRKWADNKLVHVLSPNVYRTREEALESFEWFSELGEWDRLFPTYERNLIVYVGAYAMWLIGKRLKKRHALKDDVRLSLYDDLHTWTKQLKTKSTPFSGGNKPDLADLAVYGVLSSIEGCQAFKDALQNTNIGPWFYSMKDYVSKHQGSNAMTGR